MYPGYQSPARPIACFCGQTLHFTEHYNGVQLVAQMTEDQCPNCERKADYLSLMRLREGQFLGIAKAVA